MAYVQLQEGADLSAEQILDHLKKEVGERAAIPKEVFIIPEIPLTPVGKIFKPALRWQAIKQVYQTELEALGEMTESITVTVCEDKIHGSLADVTIKAAPDVPPDSIKEKAQEILARYTVQHTLKIISSC